jgi:hypothetical protein
MKVWWSSLFIMSFLVRIALGGNDEKPPFKLTGAEAEILHGGAEKIFTLSNQTKSRLAQIRADFPTGIPDRKEDFLKKIQFDYLSYLSTADGFVKETQEPFIKDLNQDERHSAEIFFGDIFDRYRQTNSAVTKMTGSEVLNVGSQIVKDLDATHVLFVTASEDKNLFYDLEVTSTPSEATIFYKYDLDTTYLPAPRASTVTIEHLDRARTHVLGRHRDFKDQEGFYDPGTQKTGTINLDFHAGK